MKPFLPLALGLLFTCTVALANASNREDVSLHWPVIAGPHCESYGEAVAKLEKHILELATDECAEHGLHAPSAGDIQYELHAVLSKIRLIFRLRQWKNSGRASVCNLRLVAPFRITYRRFRV